MIDVLDAVYDFVLACAYDQDIPQYTEDQIIRGWQNDATLPPETQEFCIISELNTVRHGTNEETAFIDDHVNFYETIEHVIQLDFYSPEQLYARGRANIIELLARSRVATTFFKAANPDLTCLYADDPRNLTGLDDTKSFVARYQLTLHLEERAKLEIPTDYFTSINIHTENVDVHHKI